MFSSASIYGAFLLLQAPQRHSTAKLWVSWQLL
jgi:hypothetical protein